MSEVPLTTNLSVSFQRYPYPASASVASTPKSWGALPVHTTAGGDLVIPSPAGEAFWIGLVAEDRVRSTFVHVAVVLQNGERTDLNPIPVPPRFSADGIPRGDGSRWPFAREPPVADTPALTVVEIAATPAGVDRGTGASLRVELVTIEQFTALSGKGLSALNPADTYRGWLLP